MRKRLFLLALELLAISIPLTWLWIEWGRSAYPKLFVQLGTPILVFLGLPGIRPDVLPDRFISYVPFLVLMVITPRISVARRVLGTALGFALIFLSHVAFTSYVMAFEHSERLSARPFVNIFPALILLDGFPIVVWAVIAKDFLGEVASRALPRLFPRR
ncbi:hypothetical protein N9166_00330 [bacterium]|nr:hypothetical protein [bacterium]